MQDMIIQCVVNNIEIGMHRKALKDCEDICKGRMWLMKLK